MRWTISHVMKCFSFHSKKHFGKHEKRFIMFCCCILVNCDSIGDFKNALLNLFTIWISKNKTSFTENAITWLEHEADKLGDVKLTFSSFDSDEEQEMGNCDNDDDKVFKSCKRSKFYDLAKDIEKSIKQNMETEDTSAKKNVYYSLPFLEYIINHMFGLAPLWTNLLLGDIGRHGTSIIYRNWSAKYDKQQCIINATKTKGFIEKHHRSLKHIFLDEKNARIDLVIP